MYNASDIGMNVQININLIKDWIVKAKTHLLCYVMLYFKGFYHNINPYSDIASPHTPFILLLEPHNP